MHEANVISISVRLDQYYGNQSTTFVFDKDKTICIIPKDNTTIKGTYVWKEIIKNLMLDLFLFLKEYYRRNIQKQDFPQIKDVMDRKCGRN